MAIPSCHARAGCVGSLYGEPPETETPIVAAIGVSTFPPRRLYLTPKPPLRSGDDDDGSLWYRRVIKKPRFLMRGDIIRITASMPLLAE